MKTFVTLFLLGCPAFLTAQSFAEYANAVPSTANVTSASDFHKVTIERYVDEYREEYFDELIDASLGNSRSVPARRALNILAGAFGHDPRITFRLLRDIAEFYEFKALTQSTDVNLPPSYQAEMGIEGIRLAYSTLSQSGSVEALQFLFERADREYWKDRPMPQVRLTSFDASLSSDERSYVKSAQTEAIVALSRMPLSEAQDFLEKLAKDPDYLADKNLKTVIEFALSERPSILRSDAIWQEAWDRRGDQNFKALPVRAIDILSIVREKSPISNDEKSHFPSQPSAQIASLSPVQSPLSAPYYAAAIVLALLGLLVFLARRKA